MEEKTIIQNIFGTVHGHVVGGNLTQAEAQSMPVQQLPSKEQLQAHIKAAKRHKFKAVLGTYLNLPSLFLLPLFGYLAFRLLGLMQSFKYDIQAPNRPGQMDMLELAILGTVTLTLAWWMQAVRRKHSRTIQYAQDQIDQAELALQFHHR
jgi:hypothetical protein